LTNRPPNHERPVNAFERRAARAEALARGSESAQAPLEFAAGLYRAQAALAGVVEEAHARSPLTGILARDVDSFAGGLPPVLRFAATSGPSALAEEARARGSEGAARLLGWWGGDRSGAADYLSRALVRPYVEVLAAAGIRPEPPSEHRGCPFCGGAPWIACRRAVTTGDGGQRYLGCALCGGEWVVNRIRCPGCGEEDPEKLPFFQADRYPAVRLEACASCHCYLKSIDLTIDARALPEVDELLSLSMDLWAGDEGFSRIEPGLAGV
jgi:FdhE protein